MRLQKLHQIKSMRWMVIGITLIFSGCLRIEGVHYLNHYGDSDSGSYQLSMNSAIYLAMSVDNRDMLNDLYKFSKPKVNSRDGTTYIYDDTGEASMERFYDAYQCKPAPEKGWSDCTFTMSKNGLDFAGWLLDWKVVLHDEMVVLSSNHHRERTTQGKRALMWYFDGDRVSAFNVSFTVRVPNA